MFEGLQSKFDRALKVLKGQAKIRPEHIEEALKELRVSLLEADVELKVADDFLARVREKAIGSEVAKSLSPFQQFLKILYQELLNTLGAAGEFNLNVKPPVIIFMIGLQGSGKTTSSAKLATYLKKKMKRKPLLVSVDVTRPAAIEQLERLAADAKIDYFKSPSMVPKERAQGALKFASTYGLDVLIVDTAGRLSIDESMMKELSELKNTLSPHHLLYVADAMSGQAGLEVARGFSEKVGMTGAILSKADADTRGGIALSLRNALQVPLQFVGLGEKIEAFEVFHPDRWAQRVLGQGDMATLLEKAEEVLETEDRKTQEEQAKRAMKGHLTLKDFQSQMKMMGKLGSLGGVMGMIPGMSQLAGKIDSETIEKKMKRVDAMINSMTLKEREDPDLLNGSRRRRIALGSGTSVEELNQFMREFDQMQKFMKQMSGKKMRGLASMLGGKMGGLGR